MTQPSAAPRAAIGDVRSPPAPRELLLVVLLTAVALALRGWQLHLAGLSQYDEGVYAFSGLGLSDGNQPHRLFPDEPKFAPPFWLALLALAFRVGGASDRTGILVNVVLGALTIPVLWRVARPWVGGPAAVAAATGAMCCEAQIILSRSALTDVTFAIVFVAALGTLAWALARGGAWRGVVAGLATGLAWNTKYHGWFVLVAGALAIAAGGRREGAPHARRKAALRTWAIAAAVALLCYLPWLLVIQREAGATTAWASYFASMLRIDWPGNLATYLQEQMMLEGAWSRAAVPLAALAFLLARPAADRRLGVASLVLLSISSFALGLFATTILLAVLDLLRRRGRPMSVGFRCAAAVLLLWLVLAPLYQPYFRLLLPLQLVLFVLFGDALETVAAGAEPVPRREDRGRIVAALVCASAVWTAAKRVPLAPHLVDAWRANRSLSDVASEIDARLPAGTPVSVLGEPPLAFYLHQLGHPSFDRVTLRTLDTASAPLFVVSGYYARKAASVRDGLRVRAARMEEIGRFPAPPSDLRLLDDYHPSDARAYRQQPDSMYDVILFRVSPPHPTASGR